MTEYVYNKKNEVFLNEAIHGAQAYAAGGCKGMTVRGTPNQQNLGGNLN